MSNLFTETKEVLTSAASTLEHLAEKKLDGKEMSLSELNTPIEEKKENDPFSSGFDAKHPLPTVDQLRNAGFSKFDAENIVYGDSHVYSQKELFNCLYKSDNPAKAYKEMMDEKLKAHFKRTDAFISEMGM